MRKILASAFLASLATAQFYIPNPQIFMERQKLFLSAYTHTQSVPSSFKVDFSIYSWNETLGDLHMLNLTGTEFVDVPLNKERINLWMNIPNVGYGEIQQVLDFNSNELIQYIPSIDFCQKFKIPIQVNMQEVFNAYANSSTGLLEHLGI